MIDFTENHVIVQDKESERLFKNVFESVFGKFPWSQQKNLIEYKDEKNTFHEVFFTGTRDDILRKKFSKFEETGDGDRCLRCGGSISNQIPWVHLIFGLCAQCSEELEKYSSYHHIPWNMPIEIDAINDLPNF